MRIVILSLIFTAFTAYADKAAYDIYYLNKPFAHIHEKPYHQSQSQTAMACGFPVKVFKQQSHTFHDWKHVQAGENKGYIPIDYLSADKVKCFQGKYKSFYHSMDLDLADIYHWARLNERYIEMVVKP